MLDPDTQVIPILWTQSDIKNVAPHLSQAEIKAVIQHLVQNYQEDLGLNTQLIEAAVRKTQKVRYRKVNEHSCVCASQKELEMFINREICRKRTKTDTDYVTQLKLFLGISLKETTENHDIKKLLHLAHSTVKVEQFPVLITRLSEYPHQYSILYLKDIVNQ